MEGLFQVLFEGIPKLIKRLAYFVRKYSDNPKVLSVIFLAILLPTILIPTIILSRFSQNDALINYTDSLGTSIIILFLGALVGFICGLVIILIILGIIESEQGFDKYALIIMVVVLLLIVIFALIGTQR